MLGVGNLGFLSGLSKQVNNSGVGTLGGLVLALGLLMALSPLDIHCPKDQILQISCRLLTRGRLSQTLWHCGIHHTVSLTDDVRSPLVP